MPTWFDATVDTGGTGDYSSLNSWEAAITAGTISLLTSATKVFAHGGITGAMADNTAVTGKTSGATGTSQITTSGQILIKSIGATPFSSGEQVYQTLDTNFVDISDAGDSVKVRAKCQCTDGNADTTPTTITGITNAPANPVKVWTDPAESYRHDGKWSTGNKYRVVASASSGGMIRFSCRAGISEGLQVHNTHPTGSGSGLYHSTSELCEISECITRLDSTGSGSKGIYLIVAKPNANLRIWNNVVYNGGGKGIQLITPPDSGWTMAIYNNTVVDVGSKGIIVTDAVGDGSLYLKNNVVFNTGDDYDITVFTVRNYTNNMGEDADFGSTNYKQTSQAGTDIFEDYDNDDFHLKAGSDALLNGTDLSTDPDGVLSFDDDIDGDTRTGTWDIGADQKSVPGVNKTPINQILNSVNSQGVI